jgi:hypothetical protein
VQLLESLSEFWHEHYLPGRERLQALHSSPSTTSASTVWGGRADAVGIDDHMLVIHRMRHAEPAGKPTNASAFEQAHKAFCSSVRKVAVWDLGPHTGG